MGGQEGGGGDTLGGVGVLVLLCSLPIRCTPPCPPLPALPTLPSPPFAARPATNVAPAPRPFPAFPRPPPPQQELRKHASDPAFQAKWQAVKQTAKLKSIALIERLTGIPLPNKEAMLDVQVKRIHEVSECRGGGGRGCRRVGGQVVSEWAGLGFRVQASGWTGGE